MMKVLSNDNSGEMEVSERGDAMMTNGPYWQQIGRLEDATWKVTYYPPGSIQALQELATACRPYLQRKKGMPRVGCIRLNIAYKRAMKVLEKDDV